VASPIAPVVEVPQDVNGKPQTAIATDGGLNSKALAKKLGISERTVQNWASKIKEKAKLTDKPLSQNDRSIDSVRKLPKDGESAIPLPYFLAMDQKSNWLWYPTNNFEE
jgi:hypothetical protein